MTPGCPPRMTEYAIDTEPYAVTTIVRRFNAFRRSGPDAEAMPCTVKLHTDDAAGAARARKELKLLKTAAGHPGIIRVIGHFQSGSGPHALAFEPLDLTMDEVVRDVAVPETEALEVGIMVMSALKHIHSFGIVHRNVQPASIGLRSDDTVVLSDFELATHLSDEAGLKTPCGVLGFTAPEVVNGTRYGSPVDVFSLGCTLYYMLGQKVPFLVKENSSDTIRKTQRCKPSFGRRFKDITEECKLFLQLLMHRRDTCRPTASGALRMRILQRLMPSDMDECSTIASRADLEEANSDNEDVSPAGATGVAADVEPNDSALDIARWRSALVAAHMSSVLSRRGREEDSEVMRTQAVAAYPPSGGEAYSVAKERFARQFSTTSSEAVATKMCTPESIDPVAMALMSPTCASLEGLPIEGLSADES
eukprot:TRINITY_DN15402_c0_g4_i1.p1 TRINITY_DN15402_c0_g4~~TRINITY_DN15402_c0_g4_i1.p1  ORF type:complete len:421 (+),score=55.29 TRINITY_DN15402_c0_g4_i1:175-1437(+)